MTINCFISTIRQIYTSVHYGNFYLLLWSTKKKKICFVSKTAHTLFTALLQEQLILYENFDPPITKTCLYNFDPLKPHFYIVKLGFTELYIIFFISAQNIDCGYSLELPQWGSSNKYPQCMLWGSSNEYPQSMFWAEIWKILEFFIWKLPFFWW